MNDGRYKWIGGGEPLDRGRARVHDAAPPEPVFHLWLDEPPAQPAGRAKVRDAGPETTGGIERGADPRRPEETGRQPEEAVSTRRGGV